MDESLQDRPGCLALLARLFRPAREASEVATPQSHPAHVYRLRDDFLSPAEAVFLRVLREATGDGALICPKVRLADLIYAPRQEERQAALNRVTRKHLDFVLCDDQTLRPVLAIELDDRSHARPDRRERDEFVDRVLAAVGLPLVRVPVRQSYDTRALVATLAEARASTAVTKTARPAPDEPATICPRCGGALVRREARQGPRAGAPFLGCSNYPHCRYTAPV